MNKKIIALFTFSIIVFLANFSIADKFQHPMNLSTAPQDTKIIIENHKGENVYRGLSPVIISIKSSNGIIEPAEYRIYVDTEGCKKHIINIRCNNDEWYIGNIAFGKLINWIVVEPCTGNMWMLTKNINDYLSIKQPTSACKKLCISTRKQVPRELENKLIKIN